MKGVTSIQRNGSTYWYAWIDGKRKYCGKGQDGKHDAKEARSNYETKKLEARRLGLDLKVKRDHLKTVGDLIDWYLGQDKVKAFKAYERKEQQAAHLARYFSKMRVAQVKAGDMNDYRRKRKRDGAHDTTIDHELSVLRAMYNLARKYELIHPSSVPSHFPLENKRSPRRTITEQEYKALLKHADPDFADLLTCAWETAMRSEEIGNLTAAQVHLDEERLHQGQRVSVDYLHLGIFDTKTGAERIIPVSSPLKAVLKRRIKGLAPDDPVFTDKSGTYYATRVVHKMKRACQLAGIPYGDKALNDKGERIGIVFHGFRHTRTTLWVELGFSDEIIRRATGHQSLEAYRNYVKMNNPAVMMRLVHKSDIQTGTSESQLIDKASNSNII